MTRIMSLRTSSCTNASSSTPQPALPFRFSDSRRASQSFGRINKRRVLSSPLVVVGKGLEVTRNRPVGHGLGSAEQGLCCFRVFLPSLRDLKRHRALARFSGAWKVIWSQGSQLQSLVRRALKRSTHFLEQSGFRHE